MVEKQSEQKQSEQNRGRLDDPTDGTVPQRTARTRKLQKRVAMLAKEPTPAPGVGAHSMALGPLRDTCSPLREIRMFRTLVMALMAFSLTAGYR
jgi:hypothetical protein